MRKYRPNLAALLTFILLASCTPPAGGPIVTAQSPPLPEPAPVVVPTPVVPTPTPDIVPGITIPAQTPIGARLIATFCPPVNAERCAVSWRWSEIGKDGWTRPATTLDALVDSDGRRALVWAQAGNYRVEVTAACQAGIESYTADFTVGEPKPPEPVKPLSELAGKDAAALAAIIKELADAAPLFGTVEVFKSVAGAKLAPFKSNPATVEIVKRFDRLGKGELDAKQLEALLAEVITELGAPVPPGPGPTPTPGKRTIVIVRESGDDVPADARLYVQLRNGDAAKYLAEQGHTLLILDRDPDNQPPVVAEMLAKLNALGVPPPAMFVMDSAGQVLFKGPRPASVADVLKLVQDHD